MRLSRLPNVLMYTYKGGVGKTTLTYNFSHFLAMKGYRVLVLDLDCQSDLTTRLMGLESFLDFEVSDRRSLLNVFSLPRETEKYPTRLLYPLGFYTSIFPTKKSGYAGTSSSPLWSRREFKRVDLKNSLNKTYPVEAWLESLIQGYSNHWDPTLAGKPLTGSLTLVPTRTRELSEFLQNPGSRKHSLNLFLQRLERSDIFDVVVMDCPPQSGTAIHEAAFSCGGEVCVPLTPAPEDRGNLPALSGVVQEYNLNAALGKELNIAAAVLNHRISNTSAFAVAMELSIQESARRLGIPLVSEAIPFAQAFPKSYTKGVGTPVFHAVGVRKELKNTVERVFEEMLALVGIPRLAVSP